MAPEQNSDINRDISAATFRGERPVYKIKRIDHRLTIDCAASKEEWLKIEPVRIDQTNSWEMQFTPETAASLCHDEEYIYAMYSVKDKYVRCLTTEPNGPVHKDSCVEFFFSPIADRPSDYFNLEINCCGTIKLGYRSGERGTSVHAGAEYLEKILTCHSLSGTIQEEISKQVEWSLMVALPFEVLNKYSSAGVPRGGTKWRANFYKCAENNSHPHWLSWAPITSERPNFHLPQFFGEIEFC